VLISADGKKVNATVKIERIDDENKVITYNVQGFKKRSVTAKTGVTKRFC
jgi:hypothetical protein